MRDLTLPGSAVRKVQSRRLIAPLEYRITDLNRRENRSDPQSPPTHS
jgi:hypothetical protein